MKLQVSPQTWRQHVTSAQTAARSLAVNGSVEVFALDQCLGVVFITLTLQFDVFKAGYIQLVYTTFDGHFIRHTLASTGLASKTVLILYGIDRFDELLEILYRFQSILT